MSIWRPLLLTTVLALPTQGEEAARFHVEGETSDEPFVLNREELVTEGVFEP
jgi:hypothetical protein